MLTKNSRSKKLRYVGSVSRNADMRGKWANAQVLNGSEIIELVGASYGAVVYTPDEVIKSLAQRKNKVVIAVSDIGEQREIEKRMRLHHSKFQVRFIDARAVPAKAHGEGERFLNSPQGGSPYAAERVRSFVRMRRAKRTPEQVAIRDAFLASLNGSSL